MEAAIAVEGVKFLFEHGVIVANLVCDGDTKSLAAIKVQCPPEVAAIIKAHLDLNHVAKNVGKKLRAITVPGKPGKLSETESVALQASFSTAVYNARADSVAAKDDKGAATARMQSAIAAACDHHFDKHAGCGPWCKAKYPPAPPSAVAGGVEVGASGVCDGDPPALRSPRCEAPCTAQAETRLLDGGLLLLRGGEASIPHVQHAENGKAVVLRVLDEHGGVGERGFVAGRRGSWRYRCRPRRTRRTARKRMRAA